MKVSESWLREWVNTPLTRDALAKQLTMAGLEVDEVSPVSGNFTGVVVAHVRATHPHPKADKLTVCEVDAGRAEPLQIVCGASNVRAGLNVALACPGAKLPGGIAIEKTSLRGETSEGMICSSVELGLEDEAEGILELPDDAPVGTPLEDYFKLDDHVFVIELTPNRADCFCVRGVARDVAALDDCELNEPDISPVNPTHDETMPVDVHAADACPGYAVRLIRGINPQATTPLWMKERLRRGGVRPLRPAVDVTQYVMLEFGQPMHAFDASKITGHIHVRLSTKGESLVLLDGQAMTLDAGVLLIADDEKPLAIAGVMGGEASAVGDETCDVLLESAFFAPHLIAGVARAHGLCTDASQRFERGVDPALHAKMLERATELLLAITGGEPGPVTWVHTDNYVPEITLTFDPACVQRVTGLDVPYERMRAMLESLGMTVVLSESDKTWRVAVPSYRFDVRLEVDVIEEIARLHGYDALEPEPLLGVHHAGHVSAVHRLNRKAAACLTARGYHEAITYSFVDPRVQEAFYPECSPLKLENPLSSELSEMRVSLWPGLMAALIQNVSRQQETVRCFETGVVFDVCDGVLQERASLAGLLTGEEGVLDWSKPTRAYDFYDMKGDLETLFSGVSEHLWFVPEAHEAFHPGKSARVYLAERAIGWLGALHPQLAEVFGLNAEVLLFEIDLDALGDAHAVRYQPISKYPQVRRDLSLLVDKTVLARQIEDVVRDTVVPMTQALKAFDVFDSYEGAQVPEGKKSLAITLTLQDTQKTLTEDDITSVMGAVMSALETELSAQVRDGA
jgi:phenylalanyl-tRNA synthetase beta chain